MGKTRVPLYERLPEIYRIQDEEQHPAGQLRSYLALVEGVFAAIHENIEELYHDLFIETCADWVIPYIGDLLGTSHLKGDPRTLRADVADTIRLRRRKGTLGAIELLVYNLTQWGVHCAELRENMVWNQHLNHQRPDEGGAPPYGLPSVTRHTVIRGGTVTLRDPAVLSLLDTPFDPFGHTADLKPPRLGNIRYNLPNLAIFLWRLKDYRIRISKPFARGLFPRSDPHSFSSIIDPETFFQAAAYSVRFDIHPLGRPVRLFNTHRFDPDRQPPVVTHIDETPGPIPVARLNQDSVAGAPEKYVNIGFYTPRHILDTLRIAEEGLQLHIPAKLSDHVWVFRGGNLCAWENGLHPPLRCWNEEIDGSLVRHHEVAIDPILGRIAIGVATKKEGRALRTHLLLTYTYGAVGPVGAQPISRPSSPQQWHDEAVEIRDVNFHQNPNGLRDALNNIQDSLSPIVIEIHDSMVHKLDLRSIEGSSDEDGRLSLSLNRSLIIRAADNQRPIIKLAQPLRFRPANLEDTTIISGLTVRLEGLYITRGDGWDETSAEPLIARAALHSLEILDCTLDPGGYKTFDGKRAPIYPAMRLENSYEFDPDEAAFEQTPEIILQRSITGPLFIDTGYRLFLSDSIIDAGSGVNDNPETASYAVSGTSGDPSHSWGPPTQVTGITVFGRMRVASLCGRGGIWVHPLEVWNHQQGCIKFSYFSGSGDRLPQNHGCVKGTEARLRFVSEMFGQPAYGQLACTADFRIRERGPHDDAMGAFGFLLEAHKWCNLRIRFREFMPVGVRPLLIPIT